MHKGRIALLVLVILVALTALAWLRFATPNSAQPGEQVACTMDARICPDGSAVSRVPPACEFAACPEAPPAEVVWQSASDPSQGITFRYPAPFETKYIAAQDWPPALEVLPQAESCAGATRQIGERSYCVVESSEGAAGSTYTEYSYTADLPIGVAVAVQFTLRYPQCSNYDDPEKSACESERKKLQLDQLVDRIVSSVRFTAAGEHAN